MIDYNRKPPVLVVQVPNDDRYHLLDAQLDVNPFGYGTEIGVYDDADSAYVALYRLAEERNQAVPIVPYLLQLVRNGSLIGSAEFALPKPEPKPVQSSRDALLETLRSYHGDDIDQEGAHVRADEALLEYIDDPEITEAFEAIEKWYA